MKGFALEPVPMKYRKGGYALTSVWWGWIWYIGAPIYGALTTQGWPFWVAIALLLVGNWILALFNMGLGLVGSRQGLSVSMTSRYSFGNIGTYVPSAVYFVSLAGWFGVTVGILGNTMASNFGGAAWGWDLAMGLIMAILAIAGMWLISFLANWAVPVMFVLMLSATILAVDKNPSGWGAIFSGTVPATTAGYVIPIGLSIGLIMAHWIVGCALAPDVSRWAKNDKIVRVSSLSAFGISNPFIMALGVITAIGIGTSDLFTAMPTFGKGLWWGPYWFWLAILAIILIVWTTGDCQIYTSGLALSNMTKLPAWAATSVAAAIGIILAVAGIANNMISWLTILGYFVPSILGIMIADYFLVHRSKYPHPSAIKKYINPVAIVTYAICVFIEWFGQTHLNDIGVPVANSLILSIVLYFVLMKATHWLNWNKGTPEFRSYYPPGYNVPEQ